MTCICFVSEAAACRARLLIKLNKPRSPLKSRVLSRPRRASRRRCRAPGILAPGSSPWVKGSDRSNEVRHGTRRLDAIAELPGKNLDDSLIDLRDERRPFVGRIAIWQHCSHRVHRPDVACFCNRRNEARSRVDEFPKAREL